MAPLPPPNTHPAPTPGETRRYPWRFRLGDLVYVNNHPVSSTFTVTGGELWMGFPHLHLLDELGKLWRVPQLHCSSKPITYRKG